MLFLLNHIQKVFREKKDFKILMCFHSERIQLRKQDEGTQVPDIVQNLHLCSINCQHIFFSLPPHPLKSRWKTAEQQAQTGTQQQHQEQKQPISLQNTKGGGGRNDAVTQQPERAETAVQQAQAGTQAETGQPISTLYLMLMWFPSNRLYTSVCCIFSLTSSHFPQSCTVLLFALITVSPLLQAAIILSPEKLEELRKKSSVMTVFSFKFRLAVRLETLNNNNKE